MNWRYLHYLELVIEHGSFAAAARAAGVSQPAISHGMRQLQREFTTPLFVRSGRTLQPTGVALKAAAERAGIAERFETLAAPRAAPGHHERLRVGVTPSAALVCGPALHAQWCHDRPRRRLEMHSADEGRLLARLQGGELDLVISPKPRGCRTAGLTAEALYQIAPLVYARRAHPLARVQSLQDLQAASWAIVGPSVSGPVDVLQEAFAVRRMKPPRVAVSCPDYASLLHLMTRSDLLCVLPHPALLGSVSGNAVVPLRLREALPRYEMHVFAPVRPRQAVRAVIDGLRHGWVSGADGHGAPSAGHRLDQPRGTPDRRPR
ncbi:LysR family transcriptional regulator [Roseateles chitinivorans]|uniref:LysR family transcriptional regulator n=1 Tax=Roseateles chitinivorans TaxID=2917965 RepID=UPI003D675149